MQRVYSPFPQGNKIYYSQMLSGIYLLLLEVHTPNGFHVLLPGNTKETRPIGLLDAIELGFNSPLIVLK